MKALLPNISGTSVGSGKTAHFSVFCMPALLPDATPIVNSVLACCENDYNTLCSYFKLANPPTNFTVTLTGLSTYLNGTGGAFHQSCQATDLYCDVKLNPMVDVDLSPALVVAEEVEVFEAIQGLGWDCGASNGEGLSRVLAAALHPNVTDRCGYACSGTWLDSSRPNWVDATNFTDQDNISNGCSVLFLNWMNGSAAKGGLGIPWAPICQAGAGTLAATYQKVTGKVDGWTQFSTTISKIFPPGTPTNLAIDNPFI